MLPCSIRRAAWQFRRALGVAALLSLPACEGRGIADAKCDRCDELRIRTDREEYRPLSVVRFTITNRSATPLIYDWCSVAIASRTSEDRPFEAVYRPTRRCGNNASMSDVIANMKTVAVGQSVRDSVVITVSYQGQQRIHVWLIAETGIPLDGNPVASNTFDVYPGASTSLIGVRP